ncbi:hypothetical protein RvY_16172 [Ramazzottius varieornatus]|uniref:RNA helicase n=1 Tax=Ramazzottius varieornatus TaxID=947166 RepID=A0A1D1VYH4_RAMVA|nr:hypothetical protein RvY_16172 [Ramazzottius varieornatus]
MTHRKKLEDDWETETSSDSDDSDDSDDDNEMARNMEIADDFSVPNGRQGMGHGRFLVHTGSGRQLNPQYVQVQHPQGLKGKAAADYWRNYGRMKKMAAKNEKAMHGTSPKKDKKAKMEDKKERRRLKMEKKLQNKDPTSFPALLLPDKIRQKIDETVDTFNKYRREQQSLKKKKEQQAVVEDLSPPVDEEVDPEAMGASEDQYERMREIAPVAQQIRMAFPKVPTKSDIDESRIEGLSMTYLDELSQKQSNLAYQEMLKFRRKLPAFQVRQKLLDTIENNQVVVVSGETGCGKTTQLPQFILDDWIERGDGGRCRIICTQPRRISAISVSERIAKERAEKLGKSVGYQIRLEKVMPRETGSITMCTTGILLQWLTGNQDLNKISHVIVDEIHEQDILSDFLLIILKDLRIRRKDLKIVLMSATMNAEKFCAYFDDCPMVHIAGFTFPVQQLFLEDILALTNYVPQDNKIMKRPPKRQNDPEWNNFMLSLRKKNLTRKVLETLHDFDESIVDFNLILTLIRHIVKTTPEDEAILVFLSGWEDIKKLNTLLEGAFGSGQRGSRFLVIPLHSMMPTINQRQVFERPENQRKIVIATSIAETSITIDDVVHVIDTGKIKMKDFDVARNISTLTAQWVSVSNAKQRKGRAGRVKSGVCYHLFTSYQYNLLEPFPLPEMKRTRLDELILQLKLLRLGLVQPFVEKAMEPPSHEAVVQALDLLKLIGALDEEENLTPLGSLLANMPVPPQLGKLMFLACIFQCLNPILNVTAVLGYREPFCTPLGKEEEARRARNSFGAGLSSDHLTYHEAMKDYVDCVIKDGHNAMKYCWDSYMFNTTCVQLLKMKKQFAYILQSAGFIKNADPMDGYANHNSGDDDIIRAVLAGGLYPNLGTVKRPKNKHMSVPVLTQNFADKICVHPKSILSRQNEAEGIVVFFTQVKTSKIYIHDLTLLKSNLPVALFAKRSTVGKKKSTVVATIDDWLQLKCIGPGTYQSVEKLRNALDEICLDFYQSPPCQKLHIAEAIDSNQERLAAANSIIKLVIECFRFKTSA